MIAQTNKNYLLGKMMNPEKFRNDTPEALPLAGGKR